MNDYRRRALHWSTLALLAAALAYVASYVHPPGPEVAAVFGILAVVAFAAQHTLGRQSSLGGGWLAPTAAGVVTVTGSAPQDVRLAALALAALAVVGYVTYPLTARAAEAGDDVGDRLR